MAGSFRMLSTNLLHSSGSTLTASSSAATLPVSFLLDQLKSKPWRSGTGWDIVEGVNDRIDFTEGATPFVATIAPGNYSTGTLMSAAIKTAMEAAGAFTYTVTYSGATKKFTIAGSSSYTIEWQTGADQLRSVGPDLGFTVADDTGGGPYTSDGGVYQSRHWVTLSLASEQLARHAALINHNFSGTSTVQIEASEDPSFGLIETIIDTSVESGDMLIFNESAGDELLFTDQYWRLVITDRINPDGFAEVGCWILGEPVTTSVRPSINYSKSRDELSAITQAIDGANHSDQRPSRHMHGLEWLSIEDADLAILEGVQEENPPGTNFLLLFNSEDPADVVYGFWAKGLDINLSAAVYWNVSGTFIEALG